MRPVQFINVGMKYLVHESNAWGLEGVLIGKFNVDLPYTPRKWCLSQSQGSVQE